AHGLFRARRTNDDVAVSRNSTYLAKGHFHLGSQRITLAHPRLPRSCLSLHLASHGSRKRGDSHRGVPKAAGRRLVRQRPADIASALDEPAVAHGQDFRVTEALAAPAAALVGHENPIAVLHDIDERESRDAF